jgi:hypothetical protein
LCDFFGIPAHATAQIPPHASGCVSNFGSAGLERELGRNRRRGQKKALILLDKEIVHMYDN